MSSQDNDINKENRPIFCPLPMCRKEAVIRYAVQHDDHIARRYDCPCGHDFATREYYQEYVDKLKSYEKIIKGLKSAIGDLTSA